ncbi:pre-miRNA 5'-monophosphate methyltransferase isoform X2 [Pseudoliparis swirei]|uniref:pre-miRNA 5'-monophosphate methyltransferase isoform X2 n=1 Tax=Pseudoliparis swirei TaxID=2059687 RepID=UPI0024BDCC65|nr:pre-miRNA 5'-monophosphate methyltransferase isoform X2 [Pseudoliparis swirei]
MYFGVAPLTMATCSPSSVADGGINDPGAAPYGNFMNYYTFNPPENRLSLIPSTLLQDLGHGGGLQTTLLLDVGCNSGELSVAFYKHLVPAPASREESDESRVHLLGLDLDETLVQRAQQNNPLPGNISFIPLDITKGADRLREYLDRHGASRFHLCLCLAVTMWVHLNHGDSGLLRLLSGLASVSQHLLLEAQPWKCYRSAARRLRKLGRSDFDHFKSLKVRGDVAEHAREHLERNCGMELVQSFGSTTWDRKLLLFRRRCIIRMLKKITSCTTRFAINVQNYKSKLEHNPLIFIILITEY